MSLVEAAIAANRFGFGARPGDLDAIAGDPRGWLKAQIGPPAAPSPAAGADDMPLTQAGMAVLIAIRTAKDPDSRKPHQDEALALRDRDRIPVEDKTQ